MTDATTPTVRAPFEGVRQVVLFNWPRYAAAGAMLAAGAIALSALGLSPWVRWIGVAALACIGWWSLASLAASHWVYDRSSFRRWTWVKRALPNGARRWINVHSGFDETTPGLREALRFDPLVVLDIYDPRRMSEPSIARARRRYTPAWPATPMADGAPPPAARDLDAAVLPFAAHELRADPDRARLFTSLASRLAPGGRIVVVEHLRDTANFLAFGPGFTHFLSRRTWLRSFGAAGLSLRDEFRITPLVRVFVLEPAP